MAGDVFVLEMLFLVVALHGDTDGVVAVLPVDGVEQVALDGFVLAFLK